MVVHGNEHKHGAPHVHIFRGTQDLGKVSLAPVIGPSSPRVGVGITDWMAKWVVMDHVIAQREWDRLNSR
jgi:hypothetical protein